MAEPIIFDIRINGKGGHASEPHRFNNPVEAGTEFLTKVKEVTFIQIRFKFLRF